MRICFISSPNDVQAYRCSRRWLRSRPLFAVFLATDICVLVFWSLPFGRWSTDEAGDYHQFYEPVARNLLEGRGLLTARDTLALEYPPGFPWVLHVLFRLARLTQTPESSWIQGFTLLALGFTSCLLYRLAVELLGTRRAALAIALWIMCPFHLWLSKQPHSEIAFLPFLYGALILYSLVLLHDEDRRAFGCGGLCALAALVRPIAVFLPAMLALGLFVTSGRRLAWAFRKSSVIACGFVIVLLPWEGWVYSRTGEWILVSSSGGRAIVDGWTFAVGRPDFRASIDTPAGVEAIMKDLIERDRRRALPTLSAVIPVLVDKFRDDPVSMSQLLLWKAGRAWYGTDAIRSVERYAVIVQLCYLALVLPGIYLWWREPGSPRPWIVATGLVVAYFWAMSTVALSIVRYITPVLGLLFLCAAVTLDRVRPHWLPRTHVTG